MSANVTQCLDCKSNVWAGTKICPYCGSKNIGITLREALMYYRINKDNKNETQKERQKKK